MSARWVIRVGCAVALAAGLAGCASAEGSSDGIDSLSALAPNPASATATTTTLPPSPGSDSYEQCVAGDLATKSWRPAGAADGDLTSIDAVNKIRDRGTLRVGVDENTLGFASWNTGSGEIEGFEVDIAREIAKRVFGEAYTPDRVVLIPVVTSNKLSSVKKGAVDFTISANSMTCKRWEDVQFSTEYYTAQQKFLVPPDSDITTAEDLGGRSVCVTKGSSSETLLQQKAPRAVRVPVDTRTECLVRLQQGRVDAYFGHDSFLYGMLRQDPRLEIRQVLPPDDDTVSHYGIAINDEQRDFVRFVNAVLEQLRSDGTWDELHDKLEQELDIPDASAPPAAYRD